MTSRYRAHRDNELKYLRDEYAALPPQRVRWHTVPGVEFLDRLFEAMDRYSMHAVAESIGVSTQGIYYMLKRPRPAIPRPWPTPQELADFHRAYEATPRDDLAVRSALTILVKEGYSLHDLVFACKVSAKTLQWYIDPGEDTQKQH